MESRFHQRVDQAEMVQQDFHSRAALNFDMFTATRARLEETQTALEQRGKVLAEKEVEVEGLRVTLRDTEMANEDMESRIGIILLPQIKELTAKNEDL